MAAVELFDSRTGTIGQSGNQFRRIYRVTIPDSVDLTDETDTNNDPRNDADLPEYGSQLLAIPGATLQNKTTVRRLGVRQWEVALDYNIPPVNIVPTSPVPGWSVTLQMGLGQEKVFTDLQGNLIGSHIYSSSTDGPPPFTAPTETGVVVGLIQGPVQPEGLNIPVQQFNLVLTKQVFGVGNYPNYGALVGFRKKTNSDTFAGADVGTLILSGGAITEIRSGSTVDNPEGIGWNITVVMQWNSDGWNPGEIPGSEIPEIYTDGRVDAPITSANGTLVTQSYDLLEKISFQGQLDQI